MNWKRKIPWRAKFVAKYILAILGLIFILQKAKIFSHGNCNPERNFKVFNNHFSKVKDKLPKDFTLLEIGPGYSISSAVFASYFGADLTYLVDDGNFAKKNMEPYLSFIEKKEVSVCNSKKIRYKYLTNGIKSLKEIPSESVDFIFSNAVLEHIVKSDFKQLLIQTKRIIKKGGVCSHVIDLKDHLGESLNNLRFSDKFWESKLIHNSGFYTNRLRFLEIIKMFEDLGFDYDVISIKKFDQLPLRKEKLNSHFSSFSEEELLVSSFHALLYPKK